MSEITFAQAKEFLKNINNKDSVLVIHHDDGDGFCSGILFYDWCKLKGARVEEITYIIGKSSLKKPQLKKFNKIIVCDLAPDFMSEEFEKIKDKKTLYADHHPQSIPIPKEILELVTVKDGYIPSSRTAGELTELKPWLALTGTITDAGDLYPENEEFVDSTLKKIKMDIEDFKENVSSIITNFLIYFEKKPEEAFEILDNIKSIQEISKLKKYSEPVEDEIQTFVKNYKEKKEKLGDINYYYFEPKFSIKTIVANIISRENNHEKFLFASPKKDTKAISISGRTQNRKENMSEILKAGINGLEKAMAGGHNGASGGIILAKDIEKFKNNIRKFVENRN